MTTPSTSTEIAIVGAGLSGLAAAALLSESGHSVRVVEAHDVPGGRIRSLTDPDTGEYVADLGPTWVWPAYQPIIRRWIKKLGLETFDQFVVGDSVIDYGPDTPPEFHVLPSQLGNVRLTGGPEALINALMSRLPEDTVTTGAQVSGVRAATDGLVLEFTHPEVPELGCTHLVVAAPPRVALKTVDWGSTLPEELPQILEAMPTWMAPQAKVVARYASPFWRERGLSGRILSHAGPLVETHDHSGPDGSPAVIFGFVGWPADMRASASPELRTDVAAQLIRCFGQESPKPLSIHIEDWAMDPLVASPRDLAEPMAHPGIGPEILREPHADGRVWFAAAETAVRSPGLIEGALDAAERVAAGISAAPATAARSRGGEHQLQ